MKSLSTLILAASLFGGVPFMTGCDRTVSHQEKTTETPGGGVKHQETTVTEHPDGTVSKQTETKKVNP